MSNMIFVPYIYVKDDTGFIYETKYKQEMDFDNLPKIGDTITNFYRENLQFVNFCCLKMEDNKEYILDENNNLVPFSEQDAREKIIPLLGKFISIVAKTASINLHAKRSPEDNSNFEELKYGIENAFCRSFEDDGTPFSFETLQDIENQLILYSSLDQNIMRAFIYNAMQGVNTILAKEDIIPDKDNNRLYCYYQEFEEGERINHLYYSDATACLRKLDRMAYHFRPTYNTNSLTAKLKK